jgi:hypothetical protein
MTVPMQWDTRLEVKVGGERLTPIRSFSPNITVSVQALHSLEADNVAHVVPPTTFTFTMGVDAIGPAVAKLTDMALKRKPFTVEVSQLSGDDWSHSSLAFNECFITSVAGTIVIEGVPTTTFNCICLQFMPTSNE